MEHHGNPTAQFVAAFAQPATLATYHEEMLPLSQQSLSGLGTK